MKELERHWDERPRAGGRKVGTGVAPQALFGPRGGTLKIFEVHGMALFLNPLNVDRRYFLKESVSRGEKKYAGVAPQPFFARHING